GFTTVRSSPCCVCVMACWACVAAAMLNITATVMDNFIFIPVCCLLFALRTMLLLNANLVSAGTGDTDSNTYCLIPDNEVPFPVFPLPFNLPLHDVEVRARRQLLLARADAAEHHPVVVVTAGFPQYRTVAADYRHTVVPVVLDPLDDEVLVDAVPVRRYRRVHTDGEARRWVHHPYRDRHRIGRLVLAVARLRGRDPYRTQPVDVQHAAAYRSHLLIIHLYG